MSDAARPLILPAHIEETVKAIARLHAEHRERATPFERFADRLTVGAGRPAFLGWLTAIVAGWLILNLALVFFGLPTLDAPSFGWLQVASGLAALYMTILILSTQQRDDQLASYREQLILDLAILNDQRAATIIQLLEELRRDDPNIRDRIDPDAAAMSEPASPQAVLDALQKTAEADVPLRDQGRA